MKKWFTGIVISIALTCTSTFAVLLAQVENTRIEGSQLLWNALEGATGYNIYREYKYYDTVKGQESYNLSDSGIYNIVPFDDNGNFGSQYSDAVSYEPGEDESNRYTVNNYTITVHKTCTDVGPGESCVAACPSSLETSYSTRYTQYMSGGACSTSDIVEADAFVSENTYKCTVPTFSGEVVAQAICVTFY